MPQISELVRNLGEGWKVVGTGQPIEELTTIANPEAGELAAPGTPSRIQQGTGRYYVIVQDPEAHQRALYLKASPLKGGLTVPVTGQPLPPSSTAFTGDLSTIDWQQAGAVADVPAGAQKPTATGQLDRINNRGDVIPPGTAANTSDPATIPVALRDPKTQQVIQLDKDPAGTIHDVGDDVVLIKPDGSYTTVITKPTKPTTTSVTGVGLVEYDPSKPAGQRSTVLIAAPKDPSQQVFKTVNGKTFVWDTASNNFIESNLPADTEVGYTYNDPNSKWIIFTDKQGKEISRMEKPDWKPTPQFQAGQAGAADLVAAKIPTVNPTSGALEFVDNQAQIKASEATSQLAHSLGLQVAAGSMSEKQAQDLITNAINAMRVQNEQATTAANAAQNVLSAQTSGATTGANMLQARATTAQNLVQQGLDLVKSPGGRYGNYSGGIMSPMPGFGANLVQGAQGYATELGGGQAVYDTAVRMVQAADPNNQNPDRASAVALLRQLMDKYHAATGQEIPAVAATRAAVASQVNRNMTAPLLSPQPAVSGNPAFASGGAGPVMAGQFTPPPALAPGQPAATATFTAPPLATNNLANLDPRLRGAIY